MTWLWLVALWLAIGLLAVPVGVFLLQILLAGRMPGAQPGETNSAAGDNRDAPAVAVLVPAHNEEAVIGETLATLARELRPQDRLLVVADNCTDRTASLAREAGAGVVERQHDTLRGKGYALDFGVQHLAQRAPGVLVIVDADCQVSAGAIQRVATLAHQTGRPVQALYLMLPPDAASFKQRVAAWAWRLKNWARPRGWKRLGLPCQLMGTGMAFPWPMVQSMDLANGHLVEDMKLGAELALAGTPPLLCEDALVTSTFPTGEAAQQSQRKRWEHGHLSVLMGLAPSLLWRAVKARDVLALGLALDLLVPPVALLGALLLSFGLVSWMHAFAGGAGKPLLAMIFLTSVFTLAVWRAWRGWGRDLIRGSEWLHLPIYVLAKLPVYASFLSRRQKEWVRTDRD